MIRLAATSDSHVGTGRSALDPSTGLNAALLDRARVLKWVVEDAIGRGAQCILHAGDVWERWNPNPTEVRLVRDALQPAYDAGVPVVAIVGNHDQPRNGNDKHALDLLRDDLGTLHVIDRPCILNVWQHQCGEMDGEGHSYWNGDHYYSVLPAEEEEPNIQGHNMVVCQVACLPWPQTSRLLADADIRALDHAARQQLIREKLNEILRDLAAQRTPDVPCLLLAHCGIDTAEMGKQNRLGMLGGEWTLNTHELAAMGFDAVVLGHYHRPQVLNTAPWIGYTGSPECIDGGEEGEEKVYMTFDLTEAGLGLVFGHQTPYRRFLSIRSDQDWRPAVDEAGGLDGAIVRLTVPSVEANRTDELRQTLLSCGAAEVQVTIERAEATARREHSVTASTGVPEALAEYAKQHPGLEPMLPELVEEAAALEAGRGGEA